jgi:predicted transcriptional regulator
MCTLEEKFFTPLNASEYRLLDILCTLSVNSICTVPMDELARYAQSSEESIRRALRKLESVGLLKVERTKRNFGKLHKNVYHLISPSHKNVDEKSVIHKNEDEVIHKNVGSTGDIDIAINNHIENKTTSYFRCEPAPRKKKVVIVGRGWQDDDMELAGVGLFDDEVPSSQKQAPVSKRSSKTRTQRPQEEWTALDTAAEFMSKIYDKLPGISVPINTLQLQKIIAKNRKEYDLTPIIELELMRLFFDDYWFKNKARFNPQYIKASFLKFYNSHLPVALENLGLDSNKSVPESEVFSDKPAETVYASDGTPFDNSMPGRKDLELYEAQLRRTANEQGTFQS